MHGDPSKDWTVESLARQVGMSRSAFSGLFTQVVGEGPLTYLTRWRMHRAAGWLRGEPHLSVTEAAQRVGYESKAAFNRAFKRVLGTPPGAYRREGRSDGAARGERRGLASARVGARRAPREGRTRQDAAPPAGEVASAGGVVATGEFAPTGGVVLTRRVALTGGLLPQEELHPRERLQAPRSPSCLPAP
ncbi:helix-turn-helix transcriptional regulator [Hyalangium sp.]|uniref:helix-turn-helix transcriptional regulator n=1 Tax=Hyalangium sp. TaxID=2028555 RepID=UPI002D4137C3|nr:helix-turn-helix transcriptional regulator [Hyalangium sp.]HYH95141.1 helix-turn-helix transcriptional regulator [Hyalangium sp.]